ncbi:MAG: hypothetical protein ACXITV_09690 [Luteibaculaceae bacterium]
MKRLLKFFAFIFIISFAQSCSNDDPCDGVVCNNGECIDGTCACAPFFTGNDCTTRWNTAFVGDYSGTVTSDDPDEEPESGVVISIVDSNQAGFLIFADSEGLFEELGQDAQEVRLNFNPNMTGDFTIPNIIVQTGFLPLTVSGSGNVTPQTLNFAITFSVPFFGGETTTFVGTRI